MPQSKLTRSKARRTAKKILRVKSLPAPTPLPVPEEPKPVDQAIDRVLEAKMRAEFDELVRLGNQVFPESWAVRVEPAPGGGMQVSVRFIMARGRDPIDALKNAIEAHRQASGSRIVLP